MIVIGTDTHKRTHTCGAVDALTASARGELTAPAREGSFAKLLRWARALDSERVWALEDCRHVSGAFERFLVARGERVVRVAPKHMAGARRSARQRGKSDSIDAFSVARAALREGLENLPGAHLDGPALDIRLLSDHRDDLVATRTQEQQRLRWHLHDLWPELEIPAGALDTSKWLGKASRRLARAERRAPAMCFGATRTTRSPRAIRNRSRAPDTCRQSSSAQTRSGSSVRAQRRSLPKLPLRAGAVSSPRALAVSASTAAHVCVRLWVSVPITIICTVPSIDDEADSGGHVSLGADAKLLSGHAGGPRAATGDTTSGWSHQSVDRKSMSQPAADPRTNRGSRTSPSRPERL